MLMAFAYQRKAANGKAKRTRGAPRARNPGRLRPEEAGCFPPRRELPAPGRMQTCGNNPARSAEPRRPPSSSCVAYVSGAEPKSWAPPSAFAWDIRS